MCKVVHPLGDMDSSNPHHQRGWWLHHHGGLCRSLYVDKYHTIIALRWGYRRWGYRCYLVPEKHWIITTGWASLSMGIGELDMHYDGTCSDVTHHMIFF